MGHGIDDGGHNFGAVCIAHHVLHVDVRAVQMLLVGCSHLHHGSPEVADLIILVLSFGVERHGVEDKVVSDDVEAAVVHRSPWHREAWCQHVACVSMVRRGSCTCAKDSLVGFGEIFLEADPHLAPHDVPIKACGQKQSCLLDGSVGLVAHLWMYVQGM